MWAPVVGNPGGNRIFFKTIFEKTFIYYMAMLILVWIRFIWFPIYARLKATRFRSPPPSHKQFFDNFIFVFLIFRRIPEGLVCFHGYSTGSRPRAVGPPPRRSGPGTTELRVGRRRRTRSFREAGPPDYVPRPRLPGHCSACSAIASPCAVSCSSSPCSFTFTRWTRSVCTTSAPTTTIPRRRMRTTTTTIRP